MRENELSTGPTSAKMIPISSSFKEIPVIAKMRAQVANVQLRVSKLESKPTWKIWPHMAGHPLIIYQMIEAYIN